MVADSRGCSNRFAFWFGVLGAAALLAWSVLPLLGTAAPVGTVELLAPEGRRHDAARAAQVWVHGLEIDGARRAAADSIVRGEWIRDGGSLVHRGVEAGALRVTGRFVELTLLRSPWSGIARVATASGRIIPLDLYAPAQDAEPLRFVAIGGEPAADWLAQRAPALPWRALAGLALAGLLAIVLRPWRGGVRADAWVLTAVVAAHATAFLTQPLGVNADVAGYQNALADVLAGRPGYFPPGYPLFLGAFGSSHPGIGGLLAAFAQHAMAIAAALALARILRSFAGADVARAGLLVAAGAVPCVVLPQALLSENVALFGTAGALAAAAAALAATTPARRCGAELAAGALLGIACLARGTPLVAGAVGIAVLAAAARGPRRHRTLVVARILVVALSLPVAFLVHNGLRSGSFALTASLDRHLYNFVAAHDLFDRGGKVTGRFLQLAALPDAPEPPRQHWVVAPRLQRHGLAAANVNEILHGVVWEGIAAHPIACVGHAVAVAGASWVTAPGAAIPYGPTDAAPSTLEHPGLVGSRAEAWASRCDGDAFFAATWSWLWWLPLASLFCRRSRGFAAACLATAAAYLVCAGAIEHFDPRYVSAVLPFGLVLLPLPLVALFGHRRMPRCTTGSRS